MNRKKLRILAASLAAVAVIAGISAYFTSEDTVTNAFVASTLKIQIVEDKWVPDPVIVPEKKIDKNPKIKNADTTPAYVFMEVTVPAQRLVIEDASDNSKGISLGTKTAPLFRFVDKNGKYTAQPDTSEQTVNPGWCLMEGYPQAITDSSEAVTGYTYLYAYTGSNQDSTMSVLQPGGLTENALFDKVIFTNAREGQGLEGTTQNINIKAYAIQNDFLESPTSTKVEAADVWKILQE